MAIRMLCLDKVPIAVHFFENFDIFKRLYLTRLLILLTIGPIYTKLGAIKINLYLLIDLWS